MLWGWRDFLGNVWAGLPENGPEWSRAAGPPSPAVIFVAMTSRQITLSREQAVRTIHLSRCSGASALAIADALGQSERALQRDQTAALRRGEKQVMRIGPGRQGQLAEQTEARSARRLQGLWVSALLSGGMGSSCRGPGHGHTTSRWLQFGFSQTQ